MSALVRPQATDPGLRVDLTALVDSIPEAVTVWSVDDGGPDDFRLVYANQMAGTVLGSALPHIGQAAPDELGDAVDFAYWRSVLADGVPRHQSGIRVGVDPSLALEAHVYPGAPGRVTVVFENVSAKEMAGASAEIFDQVGDAIFIAGLDGQITSVNTAALTLTGWERDGLCGLNFLELVAPESVGSVAEALSSLLDGGPPQRIQIKGIRKDGSLVDVELSGSLLKEDGQPTALVGIVRDVSEREALQSELHHQAFHDPLTGLPNRALFLDRLGHALARSERSATPVVVLLLDLFDFKAVNDTLGHPAGDRVLVALAGRLESALRADDTVARLGGDEFAFILDSDGALTAARRILDSVAGSLENGAGPGAITGTLGIAFAEKGSTVESLVRDADTALYAAKAVGPGTFRVFDKELRESLLRREWILTALAETIERGEMNVHYQPILSLSDGTVVGVEALARWHHSGESVGPDEFVPLAEACGLIIPLGRAVLRRAVDDAARWRAQEPRCLPAGIFVNVSPAELTAEDYAATVLETLRAAGLSTGDLTLEMTERLLPDLGDARVRANISDLAANGVRFALDDFGTGYSGLASLKLLPLSYVKIDRQFIDAIDGRESLAPVTRASLALGKTLGLTVIAEGVETPEQLSYLREIGCDEAQGFLLGRPQDAASIATAIAGDSEEPLKRLPPPTAPLRSREAAVPATPADERERLEALWSYHVLDSAAEADFDSITRLAASICQTPMAFVSLVDAHREFFKAAVGTDLREAPRDTSFCGHAILERSIFLIPDALEDPRFATNPNVMGGTGVRFYAGVPLVTPTGHTIGELCVKDTQPRILTAQQQEALETLAGCVVAQLELRKTRAVFPLRPADRALRRRSRRRPPLVAMEAVGIEPTSSESDEGSRAVEDSDGSEKPRLGPNDGHEVDRIDDDPRSQRGPSVETPTQPEVAGDEPAG
jgi:diguanylate cyclase (GGDEF)-like protein/PAS domain S-box-containing protein